MDTPQTPAIVLRRLPLSAPWLWLRLGWRDFKRAPGIGLFYGAAFMLMGWALRAVFVHSPAYTLALSAGFLLVGPVLCLGLYRVSQRLQMGEQPDWADSLMAWDQHTAPLALFGLVLLVLEMLWARVTLVLMAISFDTLPDFSAASTAWLAPENIGFVAAWLGTGALFAALIYALSVVAIPMLLHRRTDAVTAALTSLRLVSSQSAVMALWALCISGLVLLAMWPAMVGLLVVAPVLGHASWHAYRAAVLD